MTENLEPSSSGLPGEVVLGRGQSNGIDWELLYWPVWWHGPHVACGIIGIGWGSHAPSERLTEPFGRIGTSTHHQFEGVYLVNGEVQSKYDRVTIECESESQIEATVVDCSSLFGFNFYVAVIPSWYSQVVARSKDGSRAIRSRDGAP